MTQLAVVIGLVRSNQVLVQAQEAKWGHNGAENYDGLCTLMSYIYKTSKKGELLS